MGSLLNIGTRALLANQAVLSTTGHNIANANTVGYSRQSVVLATVAGQYTGGGYIGNGVTTVTVQRNYSEFLTRQATLASSIQSLDAARSEKLTQLEDIFQGGTNGLGSAINDMLNSFSDVANAPTDLTARTTVITRANELAARIRQAASRVSDLQQNVAQELNDSVTAINSLTSRIASLNDQIARATGNGQQPNDLLDQRDQLVSDLNKYVQTSTVKADDGTYSIFVGSESLVLGNTTTPVALKQDDFGNTKLVVQRGALANPIDENVVSGGSVMGLLRFQNSDLTEATNLLGRMTVAITETMNDQHKLGLDLDGNPGGNFFQPITLPNGMAASTNTGTGAIGVTVNDATLMAASDYQITFNPAGDANVIRLSDGKVTNFPSPVPGTLTVDGLDFNITGVPAAGDTFVVKPFSSAAKTMDTAFSSPRELAVASNIEGQMGATNQGSLSVSKLTSYSAPPPANVTLTFTGANTYTRSDTGATVYTYTPGQAIGYDVPAVTPPTGWSLTMIGTPKAGDTITVQNAATSGNNFYTRNADNAGGMLDLRDKPMFDGAAMSDGYAGLMAQIGIRSQSAQYAAAVSTSVASSLETDRASVSGVNLDEEAAKLIQYQQAYQASAKMIQIAQTIFDSLIQTMTR